jgi:RNA polymerase sigma factor (sigma-70 family)
MRDDHTVVALVHRARGGDQGAWNEIVERYAPLIWSVVRRYRLSDADAHDVVAAVWLLLVESLGRLREPAALAGWLATTTRNECVQVLRATQRHVQLDTEFLGSEDAAAADRWVLEQERHIALWTAFADLPERCRALLSLLFADPPASYADVSAGLGLPVGAIGPTRQRCLGVLRRHPLMTALGEGPTGGAGG